MRHPEVHDDGVGRQRLGHGQGFVAVRGLHHLVPGVAQELAIDVPAVLDVVDEKDEGAGAGRLDRGGGIVHGQGGRRQGAGVTADDLCHSLRDPSIQISANVCARGTVREHSLRKRIFSMRRL
jgi:hypothetical protein